MSMKLMFRGVSVELWKIHIGEVGHDYFGEMKGKVSERRRVDRHEIEME